MKTFFNEFTVKLPSPRPVVEALAPRNASSGGVPVSRLIFPTIPHVENLLLLAATELTTDDGMERLSPASRRCCDDRSNRKGALRVSAVRQHHAYLHRQSRAADREPLIFEMDDTGSFRRRPARAQRHKERLGTASCARREIGLPGSREPAGRAALHASQPEELRDRHGRLSAGLVHDEAQSAHQREDRALPALAISIRCSRSRPCRARWN
jgi:hypothetical protein